MGKRRIILQVDREHRNKGSHLGKKLCDSPFSSHTLSPRISSMSAFRLGISPSQIPTFPLYKLFLKAQRKVDVELFTHHLLRLLAYDVNKSAIIIQRLCFLAERWQAAWGPDLVALRFQYLLFLYLENTFLFVFRTQLKPSSNFYRLSFAIVPPLFPK